LRCWKNSNSVVGQLTRVGNQIPFNASHSLTSTYLGSTTMVLIDPLTSCELTYGSHRNSGLFKLENYKKPFNIPRVLRVGVDNCGRCWWIGWRCWRCGWPSRPTRTLTPVLKKVTHLGFTVFSLRCCLLQPERKQAKPGTVYSRMSYLRHSKEELIFSGECVCIWNTNRGNFQFLTY